MPDGNSTARINVPHTYFLMIKKLDNTVHHLNQYPACSLICSAWFCQH